MERETIHSILFPLNGRGFKEIRMFFRFVPVCTEVVRRSSVSFYPFCTRSHENVTQKSLVTLNIADSGDTVAQLPVFGFRLTVIHRERSAFHDLSVTLLPSCGFRRSLLKITGSSGIWEIITKIH